MIYSWLSHENVNIESTESKKWFMISNIDKGSMWHEKYGTFNWKTDYLR